MLINSLISRQVLCDDALNQKDKCITSNDIISAQPERMSINLRVEKISKYQSDFSDLDEELDKREGEE